jgi:hypothetical protein
MPFAYYRRLTQSQQAVYRRSDEVRQLRLPQPGELRPFVERVEAALEREGRVETERACRALADAITERLGVPRVRMTVMAVRPSNNWGELHGFYITGHGRRLARITIWMRTAQRRQVVAFRTFLRTFLHELCHHLDYALLALPDSFHTEGFYRRETSLFRQLVPSDATAPRPLAAPRRKRSG